MKKKSGITLIALVITIIVLLILAVVSINAVVGDNGVISNAIESKIVTAIANIIFDVESNVVDINTDNILEKRKIIATEMMKKLEEKNILKSGLNTDLFLKGSTSLMQSEINDNRLVPVDLSYNGDVWYNNYKRGKILLSSQTNTIYSTNGRTKITVIDGTVEEVIENYKYYLRGLEDRDDFVCWVNGYGEIVSPYKNTVVYINIPREEEFTAIYDEDIKNGLDLRYYNIKDYIEKMLSDEEESFGKCLIGLSSNLIQGDDGNLYFEEQCTHNTYSHFYQGEMDDEPLYNLGAEVYGMDIMMSDNYEDLTTDDNGVFKGLEYIEETGEYAIPENMILMEHDYINAELISEEYNEEYNIDKANFDEISLLSDESEKNSPEINIKDIKNNDDTLDSDYDVDLDVYGTIDEVAKLLWDKKYDYGFFTIGNYLDEEEPDDSLEWDWETDPDGDDWYYPICPNEDYLNYQAAVDFISVDITSRFDYLKEMKERGVKRIYYRGMVRYYEKYWFYDCDSDGDGVYDEDGMWDEDGNLLLQWLDFNPEYTYYESTIKYIDL